MSVDIQWDLLTPALASSVLSHLNSTFASVNRPSFIGDITATSFEFGQEPPKVEVVGMGDIYKEFLEADAAAEAESEAARTLVDQSFSQSGLAGDVGGMNYPASWVGVDHSLMDGQSGVHSRMSMVNGILEKMATQQSFGTTSSTSVTPSPSFQLHLRVSYRTQATLSLSTSLLINYPSPSFMSLPISLRLAGLFFDGELVVAYEGDKRRAHVSILDPNDFDRCKSDFEDGLDEDDDGGLAGDHVKRMGRMKKASTAGERLLKEIVMRAEVGVKEKHVLKNVGKVERFVESIIRKTLEDEIVFPNFQTFVF